MKNVTNDELPDGWTICEIGEISPVIGGGTPPSKNPVNFTDKGGIPWITPADLSGYRQMYISRGKRNLTERGFSESSARMLPKGALLFSSRAPVGYVAIASNPVCTNQGFKSFILPEGFDSRFGYFYLRHIKPMAEARATGTTFKELSGGAASHLPFNVAPLAEQKRIADKLEAVLGRVDACRVRLDRVPALLKRFRQSVLAVAMSGSLTEDWREENPGVEPADVLLSRISESRLALARTAKEKRSIQEGLEEHNLLIMRGVGSGDELPDSWLSCSIGVIATVCNGSTPSRSKLDFWDGDIPWVSSGEVRNNVIEATRERITKSGYENTSVRLLPSGTVLLAMIGEGKTRGQSALLNIAATINQNIAAVVLDHGLVDSKYVWRWFQLQYEATRLRGNGTGPQALNCQRVREIPFILAPLPEQQEIVRRVEALFAMADRIEARLATAQKTVERLTPATLAKAFRGELVPQDPNDEPATELLHRLRNESVIESAPRRRKSSK